MQFEALEIQFSADDSLAMVAFLGPEAHYVVLTRDLQPSAQDVRLGLDGIHIEVDDQLHSTYGGVAGGSLFSACFELVLDDQGSSQVGETSLAISFSLPPERLTQLSEVVRVLFLGCGNFVISA